VVYFFGLTVYVCHDETKMGFAMPRLVTQI